VLSEPVTPRLDLEARPPTASDLEVGWRGGKQGGIYSPVDGGGGAAHRERRRRGGGSPAGHEVGNNIAKVRSLG
jgi:hypothetical protein